MTPFARAQRRANRRLYRAMYGAYRLLAPTVVTPSPIAPAALRRVLIVPRHAVGDLAVVTPALSLLRAVAPQARVDVLTSRRNATLLAGDPRVGRVLDGDRSGLGWVGLVRELRAEHYDMVINAGHRQHAQQGWFTALVAGRRGARVTWFRPIRYSGLFTHIGRIPGFERRHIAERLLYAVQRALGVDTTSALQSAVHYPMSLAPRPDAIARVHAALGALADRSFVAVNCWATKPDRVLDMEQTASVIVGIAARYPAMGFVLTPPPGAAAAAAAIIAAIARAAPEVARDRVLAFPPTPQLADLTALLHAASVVLTPDTANVHLASALGRPVIALFTSTNADPFCLWRPYGVPCRVIARIPGGPLSGVAPAEIVDAFVSLWKELHGAEVPMRVALEAR